MLWKHNAALLGTQYNPTMPLFKVISPASGLHRLHIVRNFLVQSFQRQTVMWLAIACIGAVGLVLGTWTSQWPTLVGTMALLLVPAFGVDVYFSWRSRRWILPLNEPMRSACRRVERALEAKGLCDPSRWRVSALFTLGHALERGMKQEDPRDVQAQCPTLMKEEHHVVVKGYYHLKLLHDLVWQEIASYWRWTESDWDAWLYAAYIQSVREDAHRKVPTRVLKRLGVARLASPASLSLDLLRNPVLSVGFLFYPSKLDPSLKGLPPAARDALEAMWMSYPVFERVRRLADTLNPEASLFTEHRWMHQGFRTYAFLGEGNADPVHAPNLDSLDMVCPV